MISDLNRGAIGARRRRELCVLACVLSVGLVAGCSRTLNLEAVRTAIEDGLEKQLGFAIATVKCPESRQALVGDTFECTADGEKGAKVTVKVTQEDDQGNVEWEVVTSEGLLDITALVQQIRQGVSEQASVEVSVNCGPQKFREAVPNESFDCLATDPDRAIHTVAVTMTDAQGNVNWRVVE